MRPDLSVVVPAYRAESWIGRALESVVRHRESLNIEIIVVEDGVFDNTTSIVKKFRDVRLITSERNRGASAARNCGLYAARSDYVLFLDADDYISWPMLAGLVSELNRTRADVAFGPMKLMGANYPPTKIYYPEQRDSLGWIAARLAGEPWAKPWPGRVAWRRSVLVSNGGWSESLKGGQDEELIIRCLLNKIRLAVSHEGYGVYWQHNSSTRITNTRNNEISAQVTYGQIIELIDAGVREAALLKLPLARFCYRVAVRSYWAGSIKEGDCWLFRARALGISGHPGSLKHSILSSILGLRRKQRISLFINKLRSS